MVQALFLSRTSEPDLFDLTPKSLRLDGYALIAWHDLERAPHALKQGQPTPGSPMRVLGYMMEGDQPIRDGQSVQRFVILPDAGSASHPAHRFGDQMIDVHLRAGSTVSFADRSLVWVWGEWKSLAGNPNRDKPLYELEDAYVENASKADIPKYFR